MTVFWVAFSQGSELHGIFSSSTLMLSMRASLSQPNLLPKALHISTHTLCRGHKHSDCSYVLVKKIKHLVQNIRDFITQDGPNSLSFACFSPSNNLGPSAPWFGYVTWFGHRDISRFPVFSKTCAFLTSLVRLPLPLKHIQDSWMQKERHKERNSMALKPQPKPSQTS